MQEEYNLTLDDLTIDWIRSEVPNGSVVVTNITSDGDAQVPPPPPPPDEEKEEE